MNQQREIETIVKAVRQALEVATMHSVSRDMKIQIAALVLVDELTALGELTRAEGRPPEEVLALLRYAGAVRVIALEANETCGGAK